MVEQMDNQRINENQLKSYADFLFEVGMLRKTPRSGYQFLGSGQESVAEHSYRTTVIGYTLAKFTGADASKTVLMCLFHDLHEARTGDFNYVNRLYNKSDVQRALKDALNGTGFEEELMALHEELENVDTSEAALAQDADQLDLILSLKEEKDLGNPYAVKWLECSVERLRTKAGKDLADVILHTDHTDWWFQGPDRCWWTRGNGGQQR